MHGVEARARNPSSEEIREYVIAHAPVTRRQLLDALGGKPQRIDTALKRMVARGAIVADGERGKRRYLAPAPTVRIAGSRSHMGTGLSSRADPPPRGVYPLYDAIVDLKGATMGDLASYTGQPSRIVAEQARRLLKLGLVRPRDMGNVRMWLPVGPARTGNAA